MRLVLTIVLFWLALSVGALAQDGRIGAYPPGSGPAGPGIGAYPAPLGTPPDGASSGPVESPLHHDQTLDYCRSRPGACNVKQPDNHDLAQHQLDEATKAMREAAPPPIAGPQK